MVLTLFMGWLLVPRLKDLATVTRPVESLIQWKTSSSPYESKDRKSQNISTFIVVIHTKNFIMHSTSIVSAWNMNEKTEMYHFDVIWETNGHPFLSTTLHFSFNGEVDIFWFVLPWDDILAIGSFTTDKATTSVATTGIHHQGTRHWWLNNIKSRLEFWYLSQDYN